MKLYVSPRAPNPRRVQMFIAEKGIRGIEEVAVDLVKGEHRSSDHRARSPLAKVPVLELDDGRYLGETRAICSYLEGLYPEPNLMGDTFEEGLGTNSTAPSSRALKTLPSSEREETTMIGVGCFCITIRSSVKPSMRGISRSRVIKSGRRSITLRRPSSPSQA